MSGDGPSAGAGAARGARAVALDLTTELWRQQGLLAAINLVVMAVVGAALAGTVAPALLAAWLAAGVVVQGARLALWWTMRAQPSTRPPAQPGTRPATRSRPRRAMVVLTTASGLVWGGLALMWGEIAHSAFAMLVPFAIAGMAAGSITLLAAHPPACVGFLVACLGPFAWTLATVDADPAAPWLAALVVLYGLGLQIVGWHLHQRRRRVIHVHRRNVRLVEELASARDELEHRVAERTADYEQANAVLAEEVRRRREAQRRERQQGLTDPLTGLANRHLFADRMQVALARARRQGRTVAVAIIDVDHFKLVNDSRGHLVGDQVLRAVAARLGGAVRSTDTLARFGGDEFVALFSDLDGVAGATRAADRLLAAMGDPFEVGETRLAITASMGIALFPEHGTSPDELLGGADVALYQAKLRGRARWEMLGPELIAGFRERRRALGEARAQLEAGALEVLFVPRRRAADGRPLAVTAVLPSVGGTAGQTLGSLAAVADAGGFLGELEDAYVQRALEIFAAQDWPQLTLTLGVSAEMPSRPRFARRLLDAAAARGVAPARLEIAVAEDGWRGAAAERLAPLARAGMRCAVDGFDVASGRLGILTDPRLSVVRLAAEGMPPARDALTASIRRAVLEIVEQRGLLLVLPEPALAAGGAVDWPASVAVEPTTPLSAEAVGAWQHDAGASARAGSS